MAYADRTPSTRRIATIAGVAAIHGVIGYVFVSGMAVNVIRHVVPTLIISNIPVEPPPPPDTPPPPERALPHQAHVAPRVTTVTPLVPSRVDDVPLVTYPITPWTPPTLPSIPGAIETTPPPAISKAEGARARGNRSDWITTADYPASSIRAEEEGSVGIRVRIGMDGHVEECTVTASSGHAALDQATCRLYQRRARFAPARDEAGTPITSSFADRIRWQLPM